MNVAIISIHKHGDAAEEHVWIDVLNNCDLSYYGLADTTTSSAHEVSNRLRHFYWWKPKKVTKGERVLLCTGVGEDGTYVSNDIKVHCFFWGLKSAVWNNDGDAAVLFQLGTWKTTRAND